MQYLRTLIAATCAAALVLTVAFPAAAQTSDDKTYLTFSGPIEIPGKTLPAGKYLFKLADSPSNRHIIQIFNDDGLKIFATLLAVPAERMQPAELNVVTFAETPRGTPPAVRYWFYPGRLTGHEFVYPKGQAMRIARAANQPVLATDASMESTEALKGAAVKTVEPNGQERAYQERSRAASQPATAGARSATSASGAANERREALPQTASPLPLIGLIGLASLVAALSIRAVVRRLA